MSRQDEDTSAWGEVPLFRAPTGSNATQNTGAVKDLEACKKNAAVSASTEFACANSLSGTALASTEFGYPNSLDEMALPLQATDLLQQSSLSGALHP